MYFIPLFFRRFFFKFFSTPVRIVIDRKTQTERQFAGSFIVHFFCLLIIIMIFIILFFMIYSHSLKFKVKKIQRFFFC